jgi:16S rRNA G527 N7-methylase RsmG
MRWITPALACKIQNWKILENNHLEDLQRFAKYDYATCRALERINFTAPQACKMLTCTPK